MLSSSNSLVTFENQMDLMVFSLRSQRLFVNMLIVWIPQGQLKRAEVERQVSKEETYTALSLKYYSFFLLFYSLSLFLQ